MHNFNNPGYLWNKQSCYAFSWKQNAEYVHFKFYAWNDHTPKMHRRVGKYDITIDTLTKGSKIDCFCFQASTFLNTYPSRQKHVGQLAVCAKFRVPTD